jgi:hypothetical protein
LAVPQTRRALAREGWVIRLAAGLALSISVGFAVIAISQVTVPGWWSQDTDAYWNAAARIREGSPLYPALSSPDASSVYRYAPWFAVVWVPLTFLPKEVAYAAWFAILLGSSGLSLWPVLRTRTVAGICLAIFSGALLIPAAASGNVQPLLVAVLLYSVERRSGPLWIAAAASLKAAPILLVAVYLGRREWLRAAITAVLTAVLVLPIFAFDLTHYPMDVGAASGPIPEWTALAFAGFLAAAAAVLARTRYAWLAASAAVLFAIPRWSYYQATFLLIGTAQPPAPARRG